jgi:MFS family permease
MAAEKGTFHAKTFISLFSLFLSCFMLLLGTGLINVLLPVRMGLEGNSMETIGLVLSLYFVGLLIGSLYCTSLIKRAEHIRLFAGCVSLEAISILICSLYVDPILWGAIRIIMGFCIACAFTAMESWLSDSSSKETRGQVLAIHNAVMLAGLFGGQFFMNATSTQDNALFVIASILL